MFNSSEPDMNDWTIWSGSLKDVLKHCRGLRSACCGLVWRRVGVLINQAEEQDSWEVKCCTLSTVTAVLCFCHKTASFIAAVG